MRVVPLTLKQANELVSQWHRHHKPAQGHRYSLGVEHEGKLVGAAITGRPVARATDQYAVAEVTRLVTDGTFNACSFLYGASAKVAKAMGFREIQTYTLPEESGASLRAAGWQDAGLTSESHRWTNRSNRRSDQPAGQKRRWRKML